MSRRNLDRDSGLHDRTIAGESSDSDAVEDINAPLPAVPEGNEEIVADLDHDPNNDDAANNEEEEVEEEEEEDPPSDDDLMANNAVKPGQLTALPSFDGERGEGFTNWLECLENANETYGWPDNALIQVVKAKGGPRVAEWDRGNRLRGTNSLVWLGDQGFRAALIARFGPKYTSATAVNAVADLKQKPRESCATFLDRVILAVDKQHFNLTAAQKREAGYRLVYDAAIMSHFGAGLREDISKVILGAAAPPETVTEMLVAAEAVEAETSKMGPPGSSALAVASVAMSSGACAAESELSYEEQLSGLDAKVEELVAAISRFRSKPFDKSKIRCYNCNRYGHFKNECKEPQKPQGGYSGNQRGRRRTGGNQGNWKSQNAVHEPSNTEDHSRDNNDQDDIQGNF